MKSNVVQLSHGKKKFIEASTNNINNGEKGFCSSYFLRFVDRFFSGKVKKARYTLVYLSLLCNLEVRQLNKY